MYTINNFEAFYNMIHFNFLGTLPTSEDGYLYHWHMETDKGTSSFYTSMPLAESKIVSSAGNVRISVNVSNEGKLSAFYMSSFKCQLYYRAIVQCNALLFHIF